jgi:hypothetical protein
MSQNPIVSKEPLLQFFSYMHLPPHLQNISKPFHDQAQRIVDDLPDNIMRQIALLKLIESKDAAVRAVVFLDPKTAN